MSTELNPTCEGSVGAAPRHNKPWTVEEDILACDVLWRDYGGQLPPETPEKRPDQPALVRSAGELGRSQYAVYMRMLEYVADPEMGPNWRAMAQPAAIGEAFRWAAGAMHVVAEQFRKERRAG